MEGKYARADNANFRGRCVGCPPFFFVVWDGKESRHLGDVHTYGVLFPPPCSGMAELNYLQGGDLCTVAQETDALAAPVSVGPRDAGVNSSTVDEVDVW